MRYYRIVKDGVRDRETFFEGVKGELLTMSERRTKCPNIPDRCFKAVNVMIYSTVVRDGARFEEA